MPKPTSASSTGSRLDKMVATLEQKLQNDPDDKAAARKLLSILDFHPPEKEGLGGYSDCQRILAKRFNDEALTDCLGSPDKYAELYREWLSILVTMGTNPEIAITQLFLGQFHFIKNTPVYCSLYLSLFDKESVIPRICHDCYKVQILPLDLTTLIQVYFALRDLKLPRDNSRKCMIEVREDIPHPYKGYIYCESEYEAQFCLNLFRQKLTASGIKNVYSGISHGCSEFGRKYPEFKYSEDGSHRAFQRPAFWDQSEEEYLFRNQPPQRLREDHNHTGITLRDVVGFRTWVDYAEMIGDKTCRQFRDQQPSAKPASLIKRVAAQSRCRNKELRELAERIASEA